MNNSITLSMVLLIGFCIIAEAARELCFKSAAHASTFRQTIAVPVVWLGFGFWAIELVAWTNVLERMPLSVAFPLMSLSYVVILLASAIIFRERINKRHAFGALAITAGVACVGATGI